MKVLQVSKFYPPDLGGIEAVARDLSAGFVRRGIVVEVLCAHTCATRSEERDALGVRITRVASAGLWLSTSMAPGLILELRRRRREADVVHVHMPDPLAALAVFFARPSARLVLHWHSDVVRQRLARHVYRPLEQWLLRRADAVIATSAAYAASSPALRRWRDKVAVIPIGVAATVPADPRRVRQLRIRTRRRRVVFALGRMTYYKGWDVLIDAAHELPDDVVVVVAGGGPELDRYRSRAERAGLAGKLLFTGPLSDADVAACFEAAEVFCMPSTVRAEAYGVAALEAMARGLPVVASDIPGSGLGWLVQHEVTGLKVPVGNAPALAAALQRMLNDESLRARCGVAGHERWGRDFTVDAMVDRVVAMYKRLTNGGDQPGEMRS